MNLNRGINLGGYLSQCDHTPEHYEQFIHKSDIETIASCGFDHVRLPMDYELLETADGDVIESGYEIVDRVLEWCKEENLNIILDLHKTAGYDFNDAAKEGVNSLFDDEHLQKRFIGLWCKIAERYGKKDFVAFELLNEVVNVEYADSWNVLAKRTITEIRKYAPDTYIIYGGVQWNSALSVPSLGVPMDDKVIFTFHYYEPLVFTHQKAYWVDALSKTGDIVYPESMSYYKEKSKPLGLQGLPVVESKAENMDMDFHYKMIETALSHAKKHGIQLYCGEFGVINMANVEDTIGWFQDVTDLFRKYKVGYSVWTYKEKDFGIMDAHYDAIRTEILKVITK